MSEEKTGQLTDDELSGPVPDDFDGEHMARRMDPSDPDFVPQTVYRDGERDSWAWQAEPDPGPTDRQMEDWNIHNDHADGAEYDDRQEFADQWEAGA